MRYISVTEIAKKWDVSEHSARNYCAQGRVNGAFLVGKTWNIPENAEKPERTNKRRTNYSVGYSERAEGKWMLRWNHKLPGIIILL